MTGPPVRNDGPTAARAAGSGPEAGFAAIEVSILAVVLVAFVVMVAVLGVAVHAKLAVASAARTAAEAAAQAPTLAQAAQAARTAASDTLVGAGASCAGGPVVTVGLGAFRPGGQATVSVACRAALPTPALIGSPATLRVHASATQPIDPYVVTATS